MATSSSVKQSKHTPAQKNRVCVSARVSMEYADGVLSASHRYAKERAEFLSGFKLISSHEIVCSPDRCAPFVASASLLLFRVFAYVRRKFDILLYSSLVCLSP